MKQSHQRVSQPKQRMLLD